MYFKCTILLLSFLLIANPVLGVGGSSKVYPIQELDEDQSLERAYHFVKTWWSIPATRNLTMNEFFRFAGEEYPVRRTLVDDYFTDNPVAVPNRDNIDIHLFKSLMRKICDGTGLDSKILPIQLMTTIQLLRQQNDRQNRQNERIRQGYRA